MTLDEPASYTGAFQQSNEVGEDWVATRPQLLRQTRSVFPFSWTAEVLLHFLCHQPKTLSTTLLPGRMVQETPHLGDEFLRRLHRGRGLDMIETTADRPVEHRLPPKPGWSDLCEPAAADSGNALNFQGVTP